MNQFSLNYSMNMNMFINPYFNYNPMEMNSYRSYIPLPYFSYAPQGFFTNSPRSMPYVVID